MSHARLVAFLVAASSLLGCSTHFITNTDVEDTPDNRKIVEFCERYRKAIERKDIPALLELASADYYENGGNVDATDDIDYAGLDEYLRTKFSDEVAAIRYEIRYRRVVRDQEYVFVDYTYSGSYRLQTDSGDKWRSTVEENRLELVSDGDGYRIVAGM